MRSFAKISLGALAVAAGVTAQDGFEFEPADFNVTEALIGNGVNVSAIPELASLVVRSSLKGCSIACNSLKLVFGSQVSTAAPTRYWSNQQLEVEPFCTFSPKKALEVSTLVLVSRLTQCPFAVLGGGHASFAGASSIEGGITVSMDNINERKLSADKKTMSVGAGNRWLDVYDYLTPYNLVVVGGRASTVGVGGLTLGGGISHHTNQHGLACDNIASYELVTATGIILIVSQRTFPDLYWALRGGGNNFGIVTTFNYETIEQGLMFTAKYRYGSSEVPALLDAFANAVKNAGKDTKLAHFATIYYASGSQMGSNELEYLTPVNVENPPEILEKYLDIPATSGKASNMTLAAMSPGLSEDIPAGSRATMWSGAFKLDRELLKRISDYLSEFASTVSKSPAVSFQAFSKPALEAMQKKGGNALGLYPEDGPFFHILLTMSWDDPKDDKANMKGAHDFLNGCKAIAKELGDYTDYAYMPYSSPYQPVISGYGAANVAKLNAVSKKYDPTGVFQKLQPGYFKLDGSAPYGTVI